MSVGGPTVYRRLGLFRGQSNGVRHRLCQESTEYQRCTECTAVYGTEVQRCKEGQCTDGVQLSVYHGVGSGIDYSLFGSSAGLRLVLYGESRLTLGRWPRVSPSLLPYNSPSATASGVAGVPWTPATVPARLGTVSVRQATVPRLRLVTLYIS